MRTGGETQPRRVNARRGAQQPPQPAARGDEALAIGVAIESRGAGALVVCQAVGIDREVGSPQPALRRARGGQSSERGRGPVTGGFDQAHHRRRARRHATTGATTAKPAAETGSGTTMSVELIA